MRKGVLITLAILMGGLAALVVWVWRSEDSIGRAAYRTDWLLLTHGMVDRSEELRDWITQYHGEAPGMAVMMRFVGWSMAHPEAAERLVAGLSATQQDEVASQVGWSAHDSGQGAEFVRVFAKRESHFFQQALKELERVRSMPSNNPFQPTDSSVTPPAKHASRHPAGG